jgi:hypothetical protein
MSSSDNTIINAEMDRLQQKEKLVDSAISGQQRMEFLNENYFERTSVYTQIIITIVICLGLFIMITLLQSYFPVIPSVITDLLSGLLFSGMIIYIVWLLYTIYIRDTINFSEIRLVSPPIKTGSATGSPPNINNSINLSTCIGSACCKNGADGWDTINSMCK